jgi:hypothetical protein
VAAVVALAPIVWAFGRLHRNAPSAGSTSDVVGKVLGPAMVLRVLMPTLAVVVVLVPLSYYEYDAGSLWPAALAAATVAVAALVAFRLPGDRIQIQQPT